MNRNLKILGYTVLVAGISYAGYRLYKWYKEEKKLEEDGLSYEELLEAHEAAEIEKRLEERDALMDLERDIEQDQDPLEFGDGHAWRKENGMIIRNITPYENAAGIEYDPMTEEVIDLPDGQGDTISVVRKFDEFEMKDRFLNYRDKRSAKEIRKVIDDMMYTIRSLKANEMEYERMIYDKDTQDSYDYYCALVLDRAGIHNSKLIDDFAPIFAWEYTPNKQNIALLNIRQQLIDKRVEYFGFASKYSSWASIGELLIWFAENLHVEGGKKSATEYLKFIFDKMSIEFEDFDAITHDTFISYLESGRTNKPNYDDTFGMFGLPKSDYDDSKSLWDEYNKRIEHEVGFVELDDKEGDEDDDSED